LTNIIRKYYIYYVRKNYVIFHTKQNQKEYQRKRGLGKYCALDKSISAIEKMAGTLNYIKKVYRRLKFKGDFVMKKNRLLSVILTLTLVVALLAGCTSKQPASSGEVQTAPESKYPEKPVTIIVPYGPGGAADTGVRILINYAEKQLGQSFVVQNVEGAGGEVGFSQMVRSEPDGYTLGNMTIGHVTLTTTRKASYDPISDIQPIALMVSDPCFIAVKADDDRFNTFEDIVKYASENPKKFTMGTSGAGASDHIAVLSINKTKGIELSPVHFGGVAEGKAGLLGGHVDAFMPSLSDVKSLVAEKKVKLIAVSADKRLEAFPDVPTFTEVGINAPVTSTRGIVAPKGIPADVLAKLEVAFKKAMEDPEYLASMEKAGLNVTYLPSDKYKELIKSQYDFFSAMAKELQGQK
jgi:tripartite-type tricarboxylate transporter receptor subunit TctC